MSERMSSTAVSAPLRLVHMSDTHNYLSCDGEPVALPDGDVLLHTGDFTNRGTLEEFDQFNAWLGTVAARFPVRIVVIGNHDVYQHRADWPMMAARLTNATAVPVFEMVEVPFPSTADGVTVAPLRVFGAPWHYFHDWDYRPRLADLTGPFPVPPGASRYHEMPSGTDVLMTHGPRYSVLDCADRVLGNLKGASPIQ